MGIKKRIFSDSYVKKLANASQTQLVWYRLMRRFDARTAFIIIMIYCAIALFVTLNIFSVQELARDYELSTLAKNKFLPLFHSLMKPFGTDNFARNVLVRAIVGTQISIFLGMLSGLLMLPIAIVLGSIAGYYGKIVDSIVIYIMGVIISIPGMLIILSLTKIIGSSYLTIAFAFAITGWVGLARVIRGSVLQNKEQEYVLAARNLGASDFRIMFIHILPNITHFAILSFVLNFIRIIKSETFLAYIGLSVIGVPTWGTMISNASSEIVNNQWQNLVGATLFMFVFLLALNVFGDAVRDVLDPKLKNRS